MPSTGLPLDCSTCLKRTDTRARMQSHACTESHEGGDPFTETAHALSNRTCVNQIKVKTMEYLLHDTDARWTT